MKLWRNGHSIGEPTDENVHQLLFDSTSLSEITDETQLLESIVNTQKLLNKLHAGARDNYVAVQYLGNAVVGLISAYNEAYWCDMCHSVCDRGALSDDGGTNWKCHRHE